MKTGTVTKLLAASTLMLSTLSVSAEQSKLQNLSDCKYATRMGIDMSPVLQKTITLMKTDASYQDIAKWIPIKAAIDQFSDKCVFSS